MSPEDVPDAVVEAPVADTAAEAPVVDPTAGEAPPVADAEADADNSVSQNDDAPVDPPVLDPEPANADPEPEPEAAPVPADAPEVTPEPEAPTAEAEETAVVSADTVPGDTAADAVTDTPSEGVTSEDD